MSIIAGGVIMYAVVGVLLNKLTKSIMQACMIFFLINFVSPLWAGPYIRMIDPTHPVTSVGGFYDPTGKKTPAYGTNVALLTHSSKDCSLFESIQADWVPLGIGAGYTAGSAFVALGPSANLAPLTKALLLRMVAAVTREGQYQNVKDLLAPPKDSKPDIEVAFGPAFSFNPVEAGEVLGIGRWQGTFRIFTGAAWKW